MNYQIVTSCNEAYLPGVLTLCNSLHQNAGDNFTLTVIVENNDLRDKIWDKVSCSVIVNSFDVTQIPERNRTSLTKGVVDSSMFFRLFIPEYFEHRVCGWTVIVLYSSLLKILWNLI